MTAIGFLRRDISGISQGWDETQMRSLAKRLGYDLAKIVVFGSATHDPLGRLLGVIHRTDAVAIFVPKATHFDDADIPAALVRVCDVITVTPEATYARPVAPRTIER
ncbi:hypothetical protein AB0H76_22755 [Nocardia sp. NPDC050712]|uniref:hypothetical protein n=1 Tax=Nocardia sp. NPDC050712 TaxID=3155518 RepID=UPI00340DD3FA